MPPLEALLVGRTLAERYRVEAVLARGGMSVVFRAVDERLGRAVALKTIALPAPAADRRAEWRERFRREAAAAARIAHVNVVQVFDFGTDPALDADYLVMELLRGRDLKQALAAGPFPIPEAVRVLREAARGLAAGHRAGFVHRDVKPANLFLVGERELEVVKILDFGIARALEVAPDDELTVAGELPHSPAYASPEQRTLGAALTPASDVFQLALVAYELCTGRKPWDAAERERVRRGERVPLPADPAWHALPPGARAMLEAAVDPDPARRPQDAAQLAAALAAPVPPASGVPFSAATRPTDDDATMLAPDVPPAAAPGDAMAPQMGNPGPAGAARIAGSGARRWLPLAVGALLVLLVAWGLRARGSRPSAESWAETAVLESEFRPLYPHAAGALLTEGGTREGPQAAAAVQRVLMDLHQAWVAGDLERHLAHYAERVRFYGRRVRPATIRRLRAETITRYPEREVTLLRQAVEFPEPGEARALVDKRWRLGGAEARWTGEALQEYRLRLEPGGWKIVGERDVEVRASERED
mgnify:CR=1 FL=1